jgi:predicted RNA-binding protein associated with RNAse of E/G family
MLIIKFGTQIQVHVKIIPQLVFHKTNVIEVHSFSMHLDQLNKFKELMVKNGRNEKLVRKASDWVQFIFLTKNYLIIVNHYRLEKMFLNPNCEL